MNKKVKYLIIGSGISGLSLANFLKNEDYLILDKDSQIGGYCKTIYEKDFIWDYAGHFYHFKTEEMKKFFIEKMKDEEIIEQNKNTKIYYNNQLVDYPFQTNIHQLEKKEFIDCLYDLFYKVEKEDYDSFLDMLYGKFGKSIVEKFLKPYNEKLYACDLNNLDKDAMGRFFPYADLKQIISNMKVEKDESYNNTFLYPKKGAIAFINKLYEAIDKNKVILSQEIIKIDNKNKIACTQQDTISYEYLINTSPLNKFFEIIENENTRSFSKQMSYNKVLVFNLGFSKKSNFDEHWIYFPEKNINFYRVGFYDNILMSDKLSLYVEIGFGKEDVIDIKKELEDTLLNLKKIGIVDNENTLECYCTIIMDPGYVHINKQTSEKIEEELKELENNNIYTIGRYGNWTYCSMEDCMIEAKKLAKNLQGE